MSSGASWRPSDREGGQLQRSEPRERAQVSRGTPSEAYCGVWKQMSAVGTAGVSGAPLRRTVTADGASQMADGISEEGLIRGRQAGRQAGRQECYRCCGHGGQEREGGEGGEGEVRRERLTERRRDGVSESERDLQGN